MMLNDDLVKFGVRKFYNDLSVDDQEQIVIFTPSLFTYLRGRDNGMSQLLIYINPLDKDYLIVQRRNNCWRTSRLKQ